MTTTKRIVWVLAFVASIALLLLSLMLIRSGFDIASSLGTQRYASPLDDDADLRLTVDSWLWFGALFAAVAIALNPVVQRLRPRVLTHWGVYWPVTVLMLVALFAIGLQVVRERSGEASFRRALTADDDDRRQWLLDASSKGYARAAHALGASANSEPRKARWLMRAVALGGAAAAVDAAEAFADGAGVPNDLRMMAHLLALSASKGDRQPWQQTARRKLRDLHLFIAGPKTAAADYLAFHACDERWCFDAELACDEDCKADGAGKTTSGTTAKAPAGNAVVHPAQPRAATSMPPPDAGPQPGTRPATTLSMPIPRHWRRVGTSSRSIAASHGRIGDACPASTLEDRIAAPPTRFRVGTASMAMATAGPADTQVAPMCRLHREIS